jgi:hypothetical protein
MLEQLEIGIIIDSSSEGDVYCEVLAYSFPYTLERSAFGEEARLVLVEANGHDPIGVVEGLLNAISMVHVNIQIKNPIVYFKQLEDAEHDIVDIAEATSFTFLSVVVSS